MPTPLETMQSAYRDRARTAKDWKAKGGKVVGYVCDNVPTELIRAAGFLPFRLSGDAGITRDQVADLITPVHARRFAGNEFIEALYAPMVAGDLQFLDFFVVPHNRKGVQSLAQSVELLRAAHPELSVPEPFYLDRTYTRTFLSSGFNTLSFMRLAEKLEAWSGKPIDDGALKAALAEAAESRRLMRELNALRTRKDPRVSGVEALEIIGASHFMAPADFQVALAAFLTEAKARAPLPGPRLHLGGSPLDHPQFYRLVEAAGAVIVSEDHCWGARCADLEVADDQPALQAMAARYDALPACSLRASIDDITASVVTRVLASGAQGAIFNVIVGDLAQMWETPSQIDDLKGRGIPSLHLRRQPYRLENEAGVAAEVAAFVASLAQAKEGVHA